MTWRRRGHRPEQRTPTTGQSVDAASLGAGSVRARVCGRPLGRSPTEDARPWGRNQLSSHAGVQVKDVLAPSCGRTVALSFAAGAGAVAEAAGGQRAAPITTGPIPRDCHAGLS